MRTFVLLVGLLLSACSSVPENKRFITVIGTGVTVDAAKYNAFNKAVEQEVGLVIMANRNIRNDVMIKNEILTHSAGYVDDFKIKQSSYNNGQYVVVVDVMVASSKIAERVLNAGGSTSNLEGNRLSTQYKTYLNNQQSSVEFLENVLSEFPSKAFSVTNPQTKCGKNMAAYCFKLDMYNNAVFEVPFEFRWNYNYLTALNETLKVVQNEKPGYESVVIISKHPSRIIGSTNLYYFHDMDKLNRIKRRLTTTIYIRAVIKDYNGNVVFSQCSPPVYQRINAEARAIIDGNEVVRETLILTIAKNHQNIQRLNNSNTIELSHTTQNC